MPSDDPNDPVIRLEFGAPAAQSSVGKLALPDFGVTLYEDAQGKVTATGSAAFTIDPDFDASFCGISCLEHWHFIVRLSATEALSLAVTGKIAKIKREGKIGTLRFGRIKFFIGLVPVWVTPKLDFYLGFEGSIEAEWTPALEWKQELEAGIVYSRAAGFDWIGDLDPSFDPDLGDTALIGQAKLPYLRTSPIITIYDATGPSLPLETYLKVRGEYEKGWNGGGCEGLLQVSALWGLSSRFKWEFASNKLGEMLHLDQLADKSQFEIKAFEWPLMTWYPESSCSTLPFLDVQGQGILDTMTVGEVGILSRTFRLTNTGGVELPWRVSYIDDNPTSVIPDSGNLAPGDGIDVVVTVDTAGFSPGVYSNPLTFVNAFDKNLPDSQTGTIEKPIRIEVVPALITGPALQTATYTGPGRVHLSWSFDPASSPAPLSGYQIDVSLDAGASWRPYLSLADIDFRQAHVTDMPKGLAYFRINAYGARTQTPWSNSLSADVLQGGVPPTTSGLLNDTGITLCGDAASNGLPCPVAGFPGQDGESGRDLTQNDDNDGHAGFSFTKLDANGNPLAASAQAWSCVRDNVTGLVWEVKTDDGGLRDRDWTYSWYNPDAGTNGGSAGYPDNGDNCFNQGRCDTDKFVADVNAQGLCGASDWRLPDPRELMSIVSNDRYNPSIDTAYFPNTAPSWFWSSSPYASYSGYAWYVAFDYGYVYYDYESNAYRVRLVRGGQ